MPAGTLVDASMTPSDVVDLTAGGKSLSAARETMRTRRPVAAGEVLRTGMVEPAPAVLRGEWASLRAGAGAVRTEARVQVLQDGKVGDSVRVRASAAASSFLAKVTGDGQLEVAQ
ncbi:flagellar basal body P-ring formation protein FlgA [Ramlibacter terrae]|uniref:Flagella basal body P-ring formation protein FlgA n=1 Tax=Ramlibacter terrae TaxID=2732511 RepID=A0ABX6P837_9BURK|nr:flagellar basal body P-ring formation protein FlgA [Ramlibacter terrae]